MCTVLLLAPRSGVRIVVIVEVVDHEPVFATELLGGEFKFQQKTKGPARRASLSFSLSLPCSAQQQIFLSVRPFLQ